MGEKLPTELRNRNESLHPMKKKTKLPRNTTARNGQMGRLGGRKIFFSDAKIP